MENLLNNGKVDEFNVVELDFSSDLEEDPNNLLEIFNELEFEILKDMKKLKFESSHISQLRLDFQEVLRLRKFNMITVVDPNQAWFIKTRHKNFVIQGSTRSSGLRVISFVMLRDRSLEVIPIHIYSKKKKSNLTRAEIARLRKFKF